MEHEITVGDLTIPIHEYPKLGARGFIIPNTLIHVFYREHWRKFDPSGLSSFFNALNMGEQSTLFYTSGLRVLMIGERAAALKKPMVMMMVDGRVVYCTPASLPLPAYEQDPITYFKFDSLMAKGSDIQMDYLNGYIRIIMVEEGCANPKEYVPCVQVRIPIFYDRDVLTSFGLFKASNRNNLINDEKFPDMPAPIKANISVEAITLTIQAALKSHSRWADQYQDWLDLLRNTPIMIPDAQRWAEYYGHDDSKTSNGHKKARSFSDNLISSFKKHLMTVDADGDVPPGSPTLINSMYAVVDTLAYYASHSDGNLNKRMISEKDVFRHFSRIPSLAID